MRRVTRGLQRIADLANPNKEIIGYRGERYSAPPMGAIRYMLPRESVRLTIRQHPAVLTMPLAAALGGLLAAISSSQIPHLAGSARLVVWILTAFLFARLVLAVLNWRLYFVALTKDRLHVVSGVFNRTVVVVRLVDLENITLERSSTGRITGHGSLTIGPVGAPQAVIDYVPYPEEIYLQIREIISAGKYDFDDDADADAE